MSVKNLFIFCFSDLSPDSPSIIQRGKILSKFFKVFSIFSILDLNPKYLFSSQSVRTILLENIT